MTEQKKHVAVLLYRNKRLEVKAGMTIWHALRQHDILPPAVLTLREGKLVAEDTYLRSGDEIEVLEVISRG